MKRPNTRRNLDVAIRRLASSEEESVHLRTTMANAVVAQMLPGGVVKGGAALKLRYGDAHSRFTTDLDTAKGEDIDLFAEKLGLRLARGWEGFTGRVAPRSPAHPAGVLPEYVMRPFDVKMEYLGKAWCTVALEVGHNEIGDADEADWRISPDIVEMFVELGFSKPDPVPLMPLHHQIAQKLHGLSEPGSERVHDLVDLQLIMQDETVDLSRVRTTCERLFAYRKTHAWPCEVAAGTGWQGMYADAADHLDVLQDVPEALEWVNGLVRKIAASK